MNPHPRKRGLEMRAVAQHLVPNGLRYVNGSEIRKQVKGAYFVEVNDWACIRDDDSLSRHHADPSEHPFGFALRPSRHRGCQGTVAGLPARPPQGRSAIRPAPRPEAGRGGCPDILWSASSSALSVYWKHPIFVKRPGRQAWSRANATVCSPPRWKFGGSLDARFGRFAGFADFGDGHNHLESPQLMQMQALAKTAPRPFTR